MKTAERIVIVLLLFILFGGGAWFYFAWQHEQQSIRDAVARGEYEIPIETTATNTETTTDQTDWRRYYPVTVPVVIGSTTVAASVADSLPERIKGLSGTPYLPEGVIKLFAFGSAGEHAIWMKDMNYALDIIWVNKEGAITHIEENVSPDTYPTSFSSPTPAWYVIEANAGFVTKEGITMADQVQVVVPE